MLGGLARFRQLLVDLAIVGVVIGVGAAVAPSLMRPSVVIESINVPLSLEERGYSGEVVARRLRDELREIYLKSRPTILTSLKLTDVAAEQKLPDIEAPGGLNLRSIITMVREVLDLNDIYVSGELTVDRKVSPTAAKPAKQKSSAADDEVEEPELPPTYVLKLRSRNTGPFYQTAEPTEDLQSVFKAAAVSTLEITNPVLAGRYYETQRRYDDAARVARLLIASAKPGEAEQGLILRGNVQLRRQNFDLAIADFEEVLRRNPQQVLAAVNIAWTHFRASRHEAAITASDRAIAIDPKAASAYAHKSNALRALGRFGEAVEVAQAGIDLEPANGQPLTALASAYNAMRRPHDALEVGYRAVQRDPTYGSAHITLAFSLQNLGRFPEALDGFRRGVELDPTFTRAWIFYGQALRRARQLPQALDAFDEALKREPANVEFLAERGMTLVELKRFADALAPLTQALAANHRPAPVALALARAELATNRIADALVHFERSVQADSRNGDAWRDWAYALIKAKRLAEAAEILGRARFALPGNAILARLQGDAWLGVRDEPKAVEAYEAAIKLDETLAPALATLIKRLRRKHPLVAAKAAP